MSKRRSINIVSSKTKVPAIASTFPTTDERYGEDKVNWDNCFICQTTMSENLQSPIYINSLDSTKSQNAYNELAERILKFNDIGLSPVPLNIDDLSGSRTLEESSYQNAAKFHKSCKLKFGNEKLERTMKKANKQGSSEGEKPKVKG